MLRGISNISVPTVSQYTAQGGRMSFPVESSSLIYSHFQYVSGVPAPQGTPGVAISRLNLLDVLIGRLNQLRAGSQTSSAGTEEMQEEQANLDAMIESLRSQIIEAHEDSIAMPYLFAPDTQTGAAFSLLV